jgi:tRNA A-37 threonylcarbamoyl transferase component Bud32
VTYLPASGDSSQLVDKIWIEVATLQRARIVHGELTRDHLLVDAAGRAFVTGFADARPAISDDDLMTDIADVIVVTTALVGEAEATAAAQAYAAQAGIAFDTDQSRLESGNSDGTPRFEIPTT